VEDWGGVGGGGSGLGGGRRGKVWEMGGRKGGCWGGVEGGGRVGRDEEGVG